MIARDKPGFTMVEFVIMMAASATIMLSIYLFFGPVDNWIFTQRRRAGFAEDITAITRLQKEVRRIKAPGQIQVFTATQLRFVDIDNNTVDFNLSGSNLMRNTDVLARNVQGLTFTYYDKDGVVAAAVAQIRWIKFEVVVVSGNQTVSLESAERIRNL